MAQALMSLDKIARDKQSDVLYISFCDEWSIFNDELDEFSDEFDWEADVQRQNVLAFLKENNIEYQACFPSQPTNGWLAVWGTYKGGVYVDIKYDKSNEIYKLLNNYLEDEHAKSRMPHV